MEKQSHKLLQSAVYQRTFDLFGLKIRIKFSKPRRKEATQNASDWGRALLQTWIKQCLNGRDGAVSALVFKTKAIEFAEKTNVENFKTLVTSYNVCLASNNTH